MKLFLWSTLILFLFNSSNVRADLIGYWKLDGDFTDSSGNGNDGTLFGGSTYTDSVPDEVGTGQSVAFDGVPGTYGSINHGAGGLAITTAPSYTVSMWVSGDGTVDNADDRIFSEAMTTNNNPLFNMGTKNNGADGTVDLFVRNGATTGHQFSNGQAFDGTWHHVAWVDNEGILDLYIDGVFDKQFDHSAVPDFVPDTTTIGGILRGNDCCNFTGSIDDVAIWDEALPEEDIAALASGFLSPGMNGKGAFPPPYLYVNFEEEGADQSENGLDGEVDGAVSFDVAGAPAGSTPGTGASFTGGHIDFPGLDMNSMIRDFEDGSYTFSCWINPIGSAGGQGFIWGQTEQGIHNGIRNGGLLHSAHWGADWNAQTVLAAEEWVHAVWTYDGAADSAAIYLNGQLDGGPTPQNAPNGGGTFVLGARNNGTEQYNGDLDDVAIWREVLSEEMIQALADGASPIGVTNSDKDGDGLPDYWEDKYDVDDPEGDPDNDGLTNADEFELRTKPNKADSDEDGLTDKEEISVTETNPLKADTDKDGLLDGVETNTGNFVSASDTGTDPNEVDSDGDGFQDNMEVTQGTDPTNENDFPQLGQTILFIGGQLEATQGADGTVMSFLEERYGGQNITYKQAGQTAAGEETEYALLVISSTPSSNDMRNKFHNSTTPIVNWEEAVADNGGGEFMVTAGRTKDNVADDHVITILEDHPITVGFNLGDEVTISTGQTEVWWSTDQQAPGSLSLASEREDPNRLFLTIVDEGGELNDGTAAPAKRVMFGITDSTFNNFTEDGKTLLGQSIDWALGIASALDPLKFTEVIYDAQEDTFRFKWNSRAKKTYALYYTEDLIEFGADIDDSIESGGDITVYPPEDEPGLLNPIEGAPKIFFRVEENQNE